MSTERNSRKIESRAGELLTQEYSALRDEIRQSIELQHRILLAGYGAGGLLFGYVAAIKDGPFWPALIGIPFMMLGMASLWIVECNRMVRASFYIGEILWPALRREFGDSVSGPGWEVWIRDEHNDIHAFGRRQDAAQRAVVCSIPIAVSVLAIAIAGYTSYSKGGVLFIAITLAGIVALSFWPRVVRHVSVISRLSKTKTVAE